MEPLVLLGSLNGMEQTTVKILTPLGLLDLWLIQKIPTRRRFLEGLLAPKLLLPLHYLLTAQEPPIIASCDLILLVLAVLLPHEDLQVSGKYA